MPGLRLRSSAPLGFEELVREDADHAVRAAVPLQGMRHAVPEGRATDLLARATRQKRPAARVRSPRVGNGGKVQNTEIG